MEIIVNLNIKLEVSTTKIIIFSLVFKCSFFVVDFNSAVPTSILRQSQPQQQQHQQQQQPPPQQINADVAVRSVINDMILAEKGGQWLLSSYFPFKGKPPFPGFEDISFEEMRYNFYTAQRNGTIEQHVY